MTTAPKIRAEFLPMIGDDHTGAGVSYAPLGSSITQTVVSLVIASSYDQSVFISVDGINDHLFIPMTSVIEIGFSENKQNIGRLLLRTGTQFFLKEGPDGPPTAGDLFISFIFAG